MAENNNGSSNYVAQTYIMILEALNSLSSVSSATANQLTVMSQSNRDEMSKIADLEKKLQEILYEVKGYRSDTGSSMSTLDLKCTTRCTEYDNSVSQLENRINDFKNSIINAIGILATKVDTFDRTVVSRLEALEKIKAANTEQSLNEFKAKERTYIYLIISLVLVAGALAGVKVFKFFMP